MSLFGGHPLSCKGHFFGDTALLFLTVPLGTLFKKTPCLTKKLTLFAIKSGLQTSSYSPDRLWVGLFLAMMIIVLMKYRNIGILGLPR